MESLVSYTNEISEESSSENDNLNHDNQLDSENKMAAVPTQKETTDTDMIPMPVEAAPKTNEELQAEWDSFAELIGMGGDENPEDGVKPESSEQQPLINQETAEVSESSATIPVTSIPVPDQIPEPEKDATSEPTPKEAIVSQTPDKIPKRKRKSTATSATTGSGTSSGSGSDSSSGSGSSSEGSGSSSSGSDSEDEDDKKPPVKKSKSKSPAKEAEKVEAVTTTVSVTEDKKEIPTEEKRKRSRSRDRRRRSRSPGKSRRRSRSRDRRRRRSRDRRSRRRRSRDRKRRSSRDRHRRRRSHSRSRRSRSRERRRQGRDRRRRSKSPSRRKPVVHRSPSPSAKKMTFKDQLRANFLKAQKDLEKGIIPKLDEPEKKDVPLIPGEKPSNLPLYDNPLLAATGGKSLAETNQATPQLAFLHTMQAMHQKAQELTGVAVPKYYNPAAVNPLKYAEQIQKRKLLWSKAKDNKEENKQVWTGSVFSQDQDGKVSAKFRKLMGIKGQTSGPEQPIDTSNMSEEQKKKQEELFHRLDKDYEFARMTTHTHRGIGLGFASQVPQFPGVQAQPPTSVNK